MKSSNVSTQITLGNIIAPRKARGSGIALPFDSQILAGQCRASSLMRYQEALLKYKGWADDQGYDALDPTTLAAWMNHLVLHTSYSPNYINLQLTGVMRVMSYAATLGKLSPEVAGRFKLVPKVRPAAMRDRLTDRRNKLSAEQMRAICDAPDVTTPSGLMHRAFMLTLASSGARISEVCNLKFTQIEQRGDGYVLRLRGKGEGTEFADAPLSPEAYKAILLWRDTRRHECRRRGLPEDIEWVFTGFVGQGQYPKLTPIRAQSASKFIRHYGEGISDKRVKPHDFRRFVGTALAKVDIRKAQKALRHKSIDTTARHYVQDELETGLTDALF